MGYLPCLVKPIPRIHYSMNLKNTQVYKTNDAQTNVMLAAADSHGQWLSIKNGARKSVLVS